MEIVPSQNHCQSFLPVLPVQPIFTILHIIIGSICHMEINDAI